MKKRNKQGIRKDRIVMLAASAFALTALTLTGVYVNQKNQEQEKDGYYLDLSSLDSSQTEQVPQTADQIGSYFDPTNNDMDVDPAYTQTEVDSAMLPAEDQAYLESNAGTVLSSAGARAGYGNENRTDTRTEADAERELALEDDLMVQSNSANVQQDSVNVIEEDENGLAMAAPNVKDVSLSFSMEEGLAWPIAGEVILNYSMDKAVFFETLNQYRYNPSIVIAAVVGEPICAAADGRVLSICDNVETGGTITCDLGDGYILTYGQLTDFKVAEGDYVERGQILGYVAEPSIFFSKEGANVYFEMTKDGESVNPITMLP